METRLERCDVRIEDVAQRRYGVASAIQEVDHLAPLAVVNAQHCVSAAGKRHLIEGASEVDDESPCTSTGPAIRECLARCTAALCLRSAVHMGSTYPSVALPLPWLPVLFDRISFARRRHCRCGCCRRRCRCCCALYYNCHYRFRISRSRWARV